LLTAPIDQVRGGQIDYLMLDYLAEVTMSIVQKQKQRDPKAGYARDFVSLMREICRIVSRKTSKFYRTRAALNVNGLRRSIKTLPVNWG
jgi:hypothetical protein